MRSLAVFEACRCERRGETTGMDGAEDLEDDGCSFDEVTEGDPEGNDGVVVEG